MNLAQSLIRRGSETRSDFPALSVDDWAAMFSFNGIGYQGFATTLGDGDREEIPASFTGYVEQAYKRNGIVFACIAARMLIFSEARFQYQQLRSGRPGDLFGTSDLDILESPWPNATTGDLLGRMLLDSDMAGNAFYTRRPPRRRGDVPRLKRLRPDWVTIVAGSTTGDEMDAELVGYSYQPGGPGSGHDPVTLFPEQVAHFAPYPDPCAQYRGMSWLMPILREILADGASTTHKLKFFEQGATPNLVVSLGDVNLTPESFQVWVDKMEGTHAGVWNAYKTLYLAAGADAKVIGSDLKQVDFKAVQGAGETRIAAAARIPPVIVGLSEGLDAATYSNYAQAKRAFADGTIRPLWRNAAGSLSPLVNVPSGARLWYDDRDIPFLQEDRKDAAEIQGMEAATIRQLVDAGYEPDSVIEAVSAEDWSRLQHSGMFSVQLHPAGTVKGGVVVGTPVPMDGSTPALPAPSSN